MNPLHPHGGEGARHTKARARWFDALEPIDPMPELWPENVDQTLCNIRWIFEPADFSYIWCTFCKHWVLL